MNKFVSQVLVSWSVEARDHVELWPGQFNSMCIYVYNLCASRLSLSYIPFNIILSRKRHQSFLQGLICFFFCNFSLKLNMCFQWFCSFQLCAKKCPDRNALGFRYDNTSELVCDYDLDFTNFSPTEEVMIYFNTYMILHITLKASKD